MSHRIAYKTVCVTSFGVGVTNANFHVSGLKHVAWVGRHESGTGIESGIEVKTLESGEGQESVDAGVGGLEASCANDVRLLSL